MEWYWDIDFNHIMIYIWFDPPRFETETISVTIWSTYQIHWLFHHQRNFDINLPFFNLNWISVCTDAIAFIVEKTVLNKREEQRLKSTEIKRDSVKYKIQWDWFPTKNNWLALWKSVVKEKNYFTIFIDTITNMKVKRMIRAEDQNILQHTINLDDSPY